jgi:hypothetical protein
MSDAFTDWQADPLAIIADKGLWQHENQLID